MSARDYDAKAAKALQDIATFMSLNLWLKMENDPLITPRQKTAIADILLKTGHEKR